MIKHDNKSRWFNPSSLECSGITIDVDEYKEAIGKVNNKLREWGALND